MAIRGNSGAVQLAELTRLVGKTRRALFLAASRELAGRNESMVAWIVAARLAERRATSQGDLSELTGQHAAGISRLLQALDRRGLTTRSPDPLDTRRRLVTLTPAGRRWHRKLEPIVLRATGRVLGVLDQDQQSQFRTLLRRVVEPRLVDAASSIPARSEATATPTRVERFKRVPGRGGASER
jgi:DNA-binding MarR family transcriptional regulator